MHTVVIIRIDCYTFQRCEVLSYTTIYHLGRGSVLSSDETVGRGVVDDDDHDDEIDGCCSFAAVLRA